MRKQTLLFQSIHFIHFNCFRFFTETKIIMKYWKKILHPTIFMMLVESFSKFICTLLKEDLCLKKLNLLGGLYFDKIVRKLKSFVTYLCDKPVNFDCINELTELS